jgi:iron only hydrogenase large subunit-like protein
MDHQYPIYTVETECQDCYKCLRHCPVKAIRVENGHAMIVREMCVACGICVEACPVHAKKIRDDLGRARYLLKSDRPVYVSLAPSWVSEFPGIPEARMITALRRLGFHAVSETALGAQEISAAIAAQLASGQKGLFISSACPAAVEYIYKYLPVQAASVTQLHSPLLAHCELLRRVFGDDIAVVFFGPCIAKKNESDRHSKLLDLALTFHDLREWLQQENIDLETLESEADAAFAPERSREGALYPVEGGMTETIKAYGEFRGARFVTLAGLRNIGKGLEGLDPAAITEPLFVECLACEGGCIAGPCVEDRDSTLSRRLNVERYTQWPETPLHRLPGVPVQEEYVFGSLQTSKPSEAVMLEALRQVGKFSASDELNCGGCGYNTCRAFATGLIGGRAEPTMCVSYMRKLAQKKANALLRCMPSGVVIVGKDMRIIECNEWFGHMFGEDVAQVYEVSPGLNRCVLAKVVPFSEMFELVLETGREIHYDHHRCDGRLFNITIFTLEPHQVVGGVILDVTRQEIRRDQIAQRADEVIKRNLSTVQEIACRLGEHMAETEILLRSIAEGFAIEDGHGLARETGEGEH